MIQLTKCDLNKFKKIYRCGLYCRCNGVDLNRDKEDLGSEEDVGYKDAPILRTSKKGVGPFLPINHVTNSLLLGSAMKERSHKMRLSYLEFTNLHRGSLRFVSMRGAP